MHSANVHSSPSVLFIIENSYVLISISGLMYMRITDCYFKSRTQSIYGNSNCEYCVSIGISTHISTTKVFLFPGYPYKSLIVAWNLSLRTFFIIRWEKNLIINIFFIKIFTQRDIYPSLTQFERYIFGLSPRKCTSSNLETYSVQIFHFSLNVTLHKSGL